MMNGKGWKKDDGILEFINSEDVRNYLRKIRYEFSPLESAWVVNHSWLYPATDKIRAWEWIVETMPDVDISKEAKKEKPLMLHSVLRELIRIYKEFGERIENHDEQTFLTEEERDTVKLLGNTRIWLPSPYKKGDIVDEVTENTWGSGGIVRSTFALDYFLTDEMTGNGYDAYGQVCSCNHVDLQYHKGDLLWGDRRLIAFRNYLRETISFEQLMTSFYLWTLWENGIKKRRPEDYSEEMLALTGLDEMRVIMPAPGNARMMKERREFYLALESCVNEVPVDDKDVAEMLISGIIQVIELHKIGMKEGLLQLEEEAGKLPDIGVVSELKNLLMLVVNGTDMDEVELFALSRFYAGGYKGTMALLFLIYYRGARYIQAGMGEWITSEMLAALLPGDICARCKSRLEKHF